jgi:hypothetical protein
LTINLVETNAAQPYIFTRLSIKPSYVWFFLRELEIATQEHQEIQKKWEVHKRQLQETHNEAKKVPICR